MMFISLGIGTAVAIALIVVVSVLTGGTVTSNNGLPTSALVGHKVAGFSLKGLSSGIEKAPWSHGHPGVLIFFASWCGPCQSEMPKVARWVATHDVGNVIVMGIDAGDIRSAAQSMVTKDHVAFAVASDPYDDVTAGVFKFGQLPETVFVSARGVVKQVYFGAILPKELSAGVAALANA